MDELLRDFLTETSESLDLVDAELVRFEQEPNNTQILANIFHLVHTIKGTCGFLALSRLETLTRGRDLDGEVPRRHAGHCRSRDARPFDHRSHQDDPQRNRSQGRRAARGRRRPHRGACPPGATEAPPPQPAPVAAPPAEATATPIEPAGEPSAERPVGEAGDRLASHSIRVSVDTLDYLMTTVSELVLTRNQLLEIVRRHEDSDFKVPLQRLSNV